MNSVETPTCVAANAISARSESTARLVSALVCDPSDDPQGVAIDLLREIEAELHVLRQAIQHQEGRVIYGVERKAELAIWLLSSSKGAAK